MSDIPPTTTFQSFINVGPKCTIFPRMFDTAFYHCHNFFHNLEHWTSEKNMYEYSTFIIFWYNNTIITSSAILTTEDFKIYTIFWYNKTIISKSSAIWSTEEILIFTIFKYNNTVITEYSANKWTEKNWFL